MFRNPRHMSVKPVNCTESEAENSVQYFFKYFLLLWRNEEVSLWSITTQHFLYIYNKRDKYFESDTFYSKYFYIENTVAVLFNQSFLTLLRSLGYTQTF
jgi:hypothetical protein